MIARIPAENTSADQFDCFIATGAAIAMAIAAGASAGGGIAAAKMGSNAANHAADAQTQSNSEALTFDKQKEADAQAQFEATQRANYDQYTQKYAAAQALGKEYGFALPDAKPYVPIASVTGQQPGQQGQPQGGGNPAAFIAQYQKTHSPTEGPAPLIAAMKQAGFNVAPHLYGQTPSGNEISLNGSKYKVISGENGPTPGWYTAGTNDSGPSTSRAPLSNPIGSYLQGTMRPSQPPQDFRLRSINAFL